MIKTIYLEIRKNVVLHVSDEKFNVAESTEPVL
jgi:hypothetical protein